MGSSHDWAEAALCYASLPLGVRVSPGARKRGFPKIASCESLGQPEPLLPQPVLLPASRGLNGLQKRVVGLFFFKKFFSFEIVSNFDTFDVLIKFKDGDPVLLGSLL